jgi:RNA polymerase sigma-70 factor (sigma-E family)
VPLRTVIWFSGVVGNFPLWPGRLPHEGTVQMGRTTDFDEFVAARSRALVKAAWLLTGDWSSAEDLLQTALAKSYLAWGRIEDGREEAYVRRVLVTTYATWWRRAWHAEQPTERIVELADHRDEPARTDLRQSLLVALAGLSRRQRATVVLRYYCDLSEADTAQTLGCSVGTVKSQAAKGLARLRESGLAEALAEGSNL